MDMPWLRQATESQVEHHGVSDPVAGGVASTPARRAGVHGVGRATRPRSRRGSRRSTCSGGGRARHARLISSSLPTHLVRWNPTPTVTWA
jgi:hypothetical protein